MRTPPMSLTAVAVIGIVLSAADGRAQAGASGAGGWLDRPLTNWNRPGAPLPNALAWRAAGRRQPLIRGDALAAALDLDEGPQLGRLLAAIDEARFAGEVSTPDEAVALAARLRE